MGEECLVREDLDLSDTRVGFDLSPSRHRTKGIKTHFFLNIRPISFHFGVSNVCSCRWRDFQMKLEDVSSSVVDKGRLQLFSVD